MKRPSWEVIQLLGPSVISDWLDTDPPSVEKTFENPETPTPTWVKDPGKHLVDYHNDDTVLGGLPQRFLNPYGFRRQAKKVSQ